MRLLLLVPLLLLARPAIAQDVYYFRAPSGNIVCAMTGGGYNSARCDIFELSPTYRTRPADCDLEWGSSFEVTSASSGYVLCAGDTVNMGGSPVLPYGQTVTLGAITCYSETTGMSCVNSLGHGFTVARAQQRVF
ncbi:DUF6636 domain-containing protein [Pelagovum pacificum]|uniref:DUF1496 domain-containing protein n=1 Tax=Pelagovum pacificum TaxID=2588711 RepID=A0A5C5GAI9_9RHOB|nr:DUF6636 domain-containing protein [Pelagovum pacificum]QQA41382.1 hypothetical protein I8N54_11125 [Pelagovum pacificum]TNY31815.1 hypothetical protein FHY64_00480 [Pelagovum pacificum]